MRTFIVHLSDAGVADRQTPVFINDDTSLGKVAQMALDDFVSAHDGQIKFPIFLDIHPSDSYKPVAWMHAAQARN
ncbi:MAG TPA: hypothetical protein VGO90_07645 [Chthoniobacteraceae bacterium]|jgi:hypothetical protein|nr:hypothetical protein [Chthoniobacteraceae bacterium]